MKWALITCLFSFTAGSESTTCVSAADLISGDCYSPIESPRVCASANVSRCVNPQQRWLGKCNVSDRGPGICRAEIRRELDPEALSNIARDIQSGKQAKRNAHWIDHQACD